MSTTQPNRDIVFSDSINELAAALAKAQGEFGAVPKNSDNPFFKSKYAQLSDVVMAASPITSKHGLSVSQFIGTNGENNDTLTTWLLHSSGQYIRSTVRLHLAKQDPQSQGSATTYARRYQYMAVLGLVADEDDDGNAGSQKTNSKTNSKSKPNASSNRSTEVTTAQLEKIASLLDSLEASKEARAQTLLKADTYASASKLISALELKLHTTEETA